MSNVERFPTKEWRAWLVYERELRALLITHGVTADEIDHVISAVKPAFLECNVSHHVEATNMDEALKNLNDAVFNQVFGLLTRLVAAELRVYRAEQGTSR